MVDNIHSINESRIKELEQEVVYLKDLISLQQTVMDNLTKVSKILRKRVQQYQDVLTKLRGKIKELEGYYERNTNGSS